MKVNTTLLKSTYPFKAIHTKEPVELILGHSREGIVTLSLNTAPSPHLGIFGESNSGKSVILRGLITQLILDKNPDEVELHLMDPKRVEFGIFKNSRLVASFSKEIEEIRETLRKIVDETERRYQVLEARGTANIRTFNQKYPDERLKYMVVIIDEFTDLAEDPEEVCIAYVNVLARKARAVGIHLVIATQRPDRDNLDSKIKANIGNILGLKTTTQINSQVIIDKPGLELLRGFGHGILRSTGYKELQSMFIDEDEAKRRIRHTFINKNAVRIQKKVRGYIEV